MKVKDRVNRLREKARNLRKDMNEQLKQSDGDAPFHMTVEITNLSKDYETIIEHLMKGK